MINYHNHHKDELITKGCQHVVVRTQIVVDALRNCVLELNNVLAPTEGDPRGTVYTRCVS